MTDTERLTPIDVAALSCAMCNGPAFTVEQQGDAEFIDAVAEEINDMPFAPPLCDACRASIFAMVRHATPVLVPISAFSTKSAVRKK